MDFNRAHKTNVTTSWFQTANRTNRNDALSLFLNTCISKSSAGVLESADRLARLHNVPLKNAANGSVQLVLQVKELFDIGKSLYSQLDDSQTFSRNIAADDQSGPSGQNGGIAGLADSGGSVYKLVLWDGHVELPAVCYDLAVGMSIVNTPIGSKLLLNNALVRRGAVLLTRQTCSVMGGDVAEYRVLTYQHRLKVKLGLAVEEESPQQAVSTFVPPQPQVAARHEEADSAIVNENNRRSSISTTSSILQNNAEDEQLYHHPHNDYFEDYELDNDDSRFFNDDEIDYESLEKEAALKQSAPKANVIVIDDDDFDD